MHLHKEYSTVFLGLRDSSLNVRKESAGALSLLLRKPDFVQFLDKATAFGENHYDDAQGVRFGLEITWDELIQSLLAREQSRGFAEALDSVVLMCKDCPMRLLKAGPKLYDHYYSMIFTGGSVCERGVRGLARLHSAIHKCKVLMTHFSKIMSLCSSRNSVVAALSCEVLSRIIIVRHDLPDLDKAGDFTLLCAVAEQISVAGLALGDLCVELASSCVSSAGDLDSQLNMFSSLWDTALVEVQRLQSRHSYFQAARLLASLSSCFEVCGSRPSQAQVATAWRVLVDYSGRFVSEALEKGHSVCRLGDYLLRLLTVCDAANGDHPAKRRRQDSLQLYVHKVAKSIALGVAQDSYLVCGLLERNSAAFKPFLGLLLSSVCDGLRTSVSKGLLSLLRWILACLEPQGSTGTLISLAEILLKGGFRGGADHFYSCGALSVLLKAHEHQSQELAFIALSGKSQESLEFICGSYDLDIPEPILDAARSMIIGLEPVRAAAALASVLVRGRSGTWYKNQLDVTTTDRSVGSAEAVAEYLTLIGSSKGPVNEHRASIGIRVASLTKFERILPGEFAREIDYFGYRLALLSVVTRMVDGAGRDFRRELIRKLESTVISVCDELCKLAEDLMWEDIAVGAPEQVTQVLSLFCTLPDSVCDSFKTIILGISKSILRHLRSENAVESVSISSDNPGVEDSSFALDDEKSIVGVELQQVLKMTSLIGKVKCVMNEPIVEDIAKCLIDLCFSCRQDVALLSLGTLKHILPLGVIPDIVTKVTRLWGSNMVRNSAELSTALYNVVAHLPSIPRLAARQLAVMAPFTKDLFRKFPDRQYRMGAGGALLNLCILEPGMDDFLTSFFTLMFDPSLSIRMGLHSSGLAAQFFDLCKDDSSLLFRLLNFLREGDAGLLTPMLMVTALNCACCDLLPQSLFHFVEMYAEPRFRAPVRYCLNHLAAFLGYGNGPALLRRYAVEMYSLWRGAFERDCPPGFPFNLFFEDDALTDRSRKSFFRIDPIAMVAVCAFARDSDGISEVAEACGCSDVAQFLYTHADAVGGLVYPFGSQMKGRTSQILGSFLPSLTKANQTWTLVPAKMVTSMLSLAYRSPCLPLEPPTLSDSFNMLSVPPAQTFHCIGDLAVKQNSVGSKIIGKEAYMYVCKTLANVRIVPELKKSLRVYGVILRHVIDNACDARHEALNLWGVMRILWFCLESFALTLDSLVSDKMCTWDRFRPSCIGMKALVGENSFARLLLLLQDMLDASTQAIVAVSGRLLGGNYSDADSGLAFRSYLPKIVDALVFIIRLPSSHASSKDVQGRLIDILTAAKGVSGFLPVLVADGKSNLTLPKNLEGMVAGDLDSILKCVLLCRENCVQTVVLRALRERLVSSKGLEEVFKLDRDTRIDVSRILLRSGTVTDDDDILALLGEILSGLRLSELLTDHVSYEALFSTQKHPSNLEQSLLAVEEQRTQVELSEKYIASVASEAINSGCTEIAYAGLGAQGGNLDSLDARGNAELDEACAAMESACYDNWVNVPPAKRISTFVGALAWRDESDTISSVARLCLRSKSTASDILNLLLYNHFATPTRRSNRKLSKLAQDGFSSLLISVVDSAHSGDVLRTCLQALFQMYRRSIYEHRLTFREVKSTRSSLGRSEKQTLPRFFDRPFYLEVDFLQLIEQCVAASKWIWALWLTELSPEVSDVIDGRDSAASLRLRRSLAMIGKLGKSRSILSLSGSFASQLDIGMSHARATRHLSSLRSYEMIGEDQKNEKEAGVLKALHGLGMNSAVNMIARGMGSNPLVKELRAQVAWENGRLEIDAIDLDSPPEGFHSTVHQSLLMLKQNSDDLAQALGVGRKFSMRRLLAAESGTGLEGAREGLDELDSFSLIDPKNVLNATSSQKYLHRVLVTQQLQARGKYAEAARDLMSLSRLQLKGDSLVKAHVLLGLASRAASQATGAAGLARSIELEHLRVLWAQGEKTASLAGVADLVDRLSRDSEGGGSGHILVKALSLQARWLALSGTAESRNVIRVFEQAKVKAMNLGSAKANLFARYAEYVYTCYRNLNSKINSNEWNVMQESLADAEEEYVLLHSGVKKSRHVAKRLEKDHFASITLNEVCRSTEGMIQDLKYEEKRSFEYRAELARQGLALYASALGAGASQTDEAQFAFRFVHLWFQNASDSRANKVVSENIGKVPPERLLRTFPQIAARMNDSREEFRTVIADMVGTMVVMFPAQTLTFLLCLASVDTGPSGRVTDGKLGIAQMAHHILLRSQGRKKGFSDTISAYRKVSDAYVAALEHVNRVIPKKPKHNNGERRTVPGSIKTSAFDAIGHLHSNVPILTEVSGARNPFEEAPIVKAIRPQMDVMEGVNHPMRVSVVAQDGKVYRQLLKGGMDDLRQSATIGQLWETVDLFLQSSVRDTNLRRYNIIPLSQQAGIIQWIDNAFGMHEYLLGSPASAGRPAVAGAHAVFRPQDESDWALAKRLKEFQAKYMKNEKSFTHAKTLYSTICERFKPVFRYFFLERCTSPAQWLQLRETYTRSVAASSVVSYICGLGDRHLGNILIDSSSGEVIHIDLEYAFDTARLLPFPEQVPCRLTRDVIDGFGVTGVNGVFKNTACDTLNVLRDNREVIRTICNVIVHDPLYRWSISKERFGAGVASGNSGTLLAGNALRNLDRKLAGIVDDDQLSVEGQVNWLIREATDTDNLALMFYGWRPYC